MLRPAINLYNTATRRVEPLQYDDSRVSLYVCGVTPYDTTHLGHAFTYVAFDTLRRSLTSFGLTVDYAQNVTDIDDDILRKSAELAIPYDQLARDETSRYLTDMASLNVPEPDHFICATRIIPDIVEAVSELLEQGYAYQSKGNIYFDRRRFPRYGELSWAPREQMIELAATHGGFPDDPRKRDPLDFLLWQAEQAGEPSWPAPFGEGRPGWHIECSTIAASVLGLPVDIHGGGRDLVFPHHESEIAQVESVHPSPFVRHWMHTGMVRFEGEKMSKSLRNLVLVRDLLERYSPSVVRLYLLSHHYRSDFEFFETDLAAMVELDVRLSRLAGNPEGSLAQAASPAAQEASDLLRNDLDTPAVVDLLRRLAVAAETNPLDREAPGAILHIAGVLGVPLSATSTVLQP